MAAYYPVGLRVEGRRCLVIGDDVVAATRARRLAAAGGRVTVIGAHPSPEIREAATEGVVQLEAREFRLDAVAGYDVVILTRRDSVLASALFRRSHAARYLLCCIDQPECSHFAHMALVETGPMQIAIASDGRAPALVRAVRTLIGQLFNSRFGRFAERIAAMREAIKDLPFEVRKDHMDEAMSGLRAAGSLVYPEWFVSDERAQPAEADAASHSSRPPPPMTVPPPPVMTRTSRPPPPPPEPLVLVDEDDTDPRLSTRRTDETRPVPTVPNGVADPRKQ